MPAQKNLRVDDQIPVDAIRNLCPQWPERNQVQWFDSWQPFFDDLLCLFPEFDDYPPDLYSLIAKHKSQSIKRFGLVFRDGECIGLAGLRKEGLHWVPITQWIVPGGGIPVKAGCLPDLLNEIRQDIWVAWWRMFAPVVKCRNLRYSEATQTYGIHCSDDFEDYWRSTGNFKTVRLRRNRCKNFKFDVNLPGALEWITQNWAKKWFPAGSSFDVSAHLAAAKFLSHHGMQHAFTLSDKGNFVAGATMLVHRGDLVASVCYRRPEYDWYGVGDRLIDHIFGWAAGSSYRAIDLGGGQDYKVKWAPPNGERHLLNVCPSHLYSVRKVAGWVKRLVKPFRESGGGGSRHAETQVECE